MIDMSIVDSVTIDTELFDLCCLKYITKKTTDLEHEMTEIIYSLKSD